MKLNPLNMMAVGLLSILFGSIIIQGGLVPVGVTIMGVGGFIIVFGPIFLTINKIYEGL